MTPATPTDEVSSIERAIETLEEQRALLGDAVVTTALQPLRQRLAALQAESTGGQRKLVTVLFADLVDFTVLSGALDAEDTREVVNAYFRRWHQQITAHGGVVEKFIGDAVMAVFGLHQAREDDPRQAIRAALGMTAAMGELNAGLQQQHGVELTMRVGIDTGDVVVSTVEERPGHEFVAVGETVNRASRLQGAAPPGGVLISAETHRHVRGRFSLEPLPALVLKGIDEPVTAYRVLNERPRDFSLDPARGVEGVESATIGRDVELRLLQERFRDVADERRWQVVTIVGDAGVGKSRLLLEFDRWIGEQPENIWWFRGRASSSDQDRAGALLRDVITTRFRIQESDDQSAVRAKVFTGFELAYGPGDATAAKAQLVGTWLGLDLGDPASGEALPRDPQSLREQAMAALSDSLAVLSQRAPVVLLLEDLHWADDGSLAWLDAADAVLRDTPTLVVATARPALFERRPHWGEGLDHHSRMDLPPLSRRGSRALVSELLRRHADVPAAVTDLVVTVAEGNPFYIEELIQWLLDTGVLAQAEEGWQVDEQRLTQAAVPSTLKGVLQARLDALSVSDRLVLQRASVLGRVFWDDAVRHLGVDRSDGTVDDAVTTEALDRLRNRDVVFERERSSFDATREFVFKHALLRDVSYDGVLKAQRQTYHGLAASWLQHVSDRTSRRDEYAALIAEHLDRAADPTASQWYLRAGRRAAGVHALDEALRLLNRGIDADTGDDPALTFDLLAARESVNQRRGERSLQEEDLAAMTALLDGTSAPDRAEGRDQRSGPTGTAVLDDPGRRTTMLLARARWQFGASAYDEVGRTADEAVATAVAAGLVAREAEAHLWRGKALTWCGAHDRARAALERALAAGRDAQDVQTVGESLRYLAMVASDAGDYPGALDLLGVARGVYVDGGDVDGEAAILAQYGTVSYNMGRFDEARAYLEEALPVFRLSGYRYREAVALGNIASIAFMQGELGVARRLAAEVVDVWAALGDKEAEATVLNVLGHVESNVGMTRAAEEHLTRALAIGEDVHAPTIMSDSLLRLALNALTVDRVVEAGRYAARAESVIEELPSALERGQVRLVQAYVLAARLELTDEPDDGGDDRAELYRTAAAHFTAAGTFFGEVGHRQHELEARAGIAAIELRQGDASGALRRVGRLLGSLDVTGLQGAFRPAHVLLACHRVLTSCADDRASIVRDAARAYLDSRTTRIDEDGLRAAYLSAADSVTIERIAAAE